MSNTTQLKPPLSVRLCAPRGFCAGVDRANQIFELALEKYGSPVYVRHEIVHNKFVVGAPNSSNSQRLLEVAERAGCKVAVLKQHASDIQSSDFEGVQSLGLTAGASAPETLVEEINSVFSDRFDVTVKRVQTDEETFSFNLPRELRDVVPANKAATG